MNRNLRFAIFGAGMAGILAAHRLREAGFNNIVVLEKGDSVGGTWRENRYAGLACDTPSHAYSYSFARNPDWSALYAPGPEIHAYFKRVANETGVIELVKFGEEVTGCTWDGAHWNIETSTGFTCAADIVIAATGVLHHPNIPEFPGQADFKGPIFHSARWPDDINLEGKRVGVIGNGSTGVQIVTALSTVAARTVHFQRSPQWIIPVENHRYTAEEKRAFREDYSLIDEIKYGEAYFGSVRRFNNAIADAESAEIREIEQECLKNLETNVPDPVLREKLRPNYRAACKRLIYSGEYYPAVQRDGVEVVVDRIDRFEAEGVRTADGTLHELDAIVLATGFKADRFMRPMNLVGRNGTSLNDVWAKRPSALLAISLPDFPNLFLLNGPTGPVGNFSLIEIAEMQFEYISQLIDLIAQDKASQISASHAAMRDYEARRIEAAKKTIFGSGCSSWYLDEDGVPATWPFGYDAFVELMKKPQLNDYELITGS